MLSRSPATLLHRARTLHEKAGLRALGFGAVRLALPSPGDAYLDLARRELERGSPRSVPLAERLATYRRGFTTRLYFLYGFDRGNDPDAYLSEVARKAHADALNDAPALVDDKVRFHEAFAERGIEDLLPSRYGTIEDGAFRGRDGETLREVLRREGALVVKEARGGGGSGVSICEWDDGAVRVDGRRRSPGALDEVVGRIDRGIVTAFCEQAPYLDALYPGSPNTLRVLVVDPAGGEAFVPAAAQRIGTDRTGGLDNFTRGGLSAEVDVETGELGPGVEYRGEGVVVSHDAHPDTGAQIAGEAVPGWDAIRTRLRELTAALSGLRYVGWDVLATGPGEFVLVEGNSYPDPDVLQAHRPLLADPRLREFYRANGVPVDA